MALFLGVEGVEILDSVSLRASTLLPQFLQLITLLLAQNMHFISLQDFFQTTN